MSEPSNIRILSVDDHPLLREGIAAIINNQPDLVLVSQATNAAEAIQHHRQHRPDVTLMDLRLPDLSGIEALIAIRAEAPEVRIIILTTFEGDHDIERALEAGARGYALKSMPPSELADVIRQVHSGEKSTPARTTKHREDSPEAAPAGRVNLKGRIHGIAGAVRRGIAELVRFPGKQ